MSQFDAPENNTPEKVAARLGFEALEGEATDDGRIRAIARADSVFVLQRIDRRLANIEKRREQTINDMTLSQIEAMADRLGAAARTIRDAQALLKPSPGAVAIPPSADGTPLPSAAGPLDAAAAHRLRQLQPPEQSSKSQLTAAEQAEKRRHMAQFTPGTDPDLPDDIAAMERGT